MCCNPRKWQKVSIGALHDCFFVEEEDADEEDDDRPIHENSLNLLIEQDTETQRADLFTKPLTPDRHWKLCALVRLVVFRTGALWG